MLKQDAIGVAEVEPLAASAPRDAARIRSVATDKCRICFPFAGGLIGGSHISALKLIQALAHTPFEPVVLLHSLDGPLTGLIERAGVRFELAPTPDYLQPGSASFRKLIRMPGEIARMRAFLRERNIRIVHTNEGPMHATWGLPARLAGAGHVWHHRGNPRAAGLRFLAPLTAHKVVCVSHFAAPHPGLWSAQGKASVAYSPFDTSISQINRADARAQMQARYGIAPDTAIIAFLGQFASRKRPVLFVEAIAAMRQARPDLKIVGLLFGEEYEPGSEAEIRRRIEELGVADSVRLMGFVQPVEPCLAGSDVLLVPAVEEPFGRTLIEAMLVGTPVVAAASGGNIEAIRNRSTGLLARADDPVDLANHVTSLIEDRGMAGSIAHRARQEALMKFSVETHVRKITGIYQEVLAA